MSGRYDVMSVPGRAEYGSDTAWFVTDRDGPRRPETYLGDGEDARRRACVTVSHLNAVVETFGALPEPRSRALIACQIQSGPGRTWTNRTYEAIRTADGQWRIDFGEGGLEPRRSWIDVLDWLWHLAPRDVEMLASDGDLGESK